MVQRMERDAEVDALKSRLAAAEARAERAVGLLREAEQYGNFGCSDDFHGQIGCASDGGLILRDGWLARIDALLKEVAHGQQGSEMVEEAASALLACLDRHIASLAGLFGDLDLAVDALRAALALPADAPEGAGEAVAFNEDVEREKADDELARECFDGPALSAREADLWIEGWLARARHAHPTPRAEAASAEAYAQGVIDGQRHERSLPAAPASAEAAQAEAGTLREQLLAEQGVVIGMRRAARGEFVEPHDAREDAVRDLWRAWSRLASEKAGKSVAEAVATASAEAVREACAKACDDLVARANEKVREWSMSDHGREAAAMVERYHASAYREAAAAIRSLPLPAAPASAEGVADRIFLILGVHRDKMPNEAVESLQAVAHALRAKGAK